MALGFPEFGRGVYCSGAVGFWDLGFGVYVLSRG